MEVSQASVFALSLVFASLMWPGATHALASADNVSKALQTSQPSSIQLTLSKQAQTAVRLEARAAPLGQILKAIADKTGAVIHYSVLPQEPVTANCVGANVRHVMECLLGSRVDRVYRNPQSGLANLNTAKSSNTHVRHNSGQAEEIWILGSRFGQEVKVLADCTLDGSKQGVTSRNSDSIQNPQSVLLQMAQLSQDGQYAELRKQALSLLAAQGKTGDPEADAETTAALQAALTDKDTDIRAQAVFGLTQQESPNSGQVLHDAIQDKNSDVRLMAVDSAKAENPDGQVILQQALNDSDETVKAAASAKLGMEYIEPGQ
jgi:hypothetical protein